MIGRCLKQFDELPVSVLSFMGSRRRRCRRFPTIVVISSSLSLQEEHGTRTILFQHQYRRGPTGLCRIISKPVDTSPTAEVDTSNIEAYADPSTQTSTPSDPEHVQETRPVQSLSSTLPTNSEAMPSTPNSTVSSPGPTTLRLSNHSQTAQQGSDATSTPVSSSSISHPARSEPSTDHTPTPSLPPSGETDSSKFIFGLGASPSNPKPIPKPLNRRVQALKHSTSSRHRRAPVKSTLDADTRALEAYLLASQEQSEVDTFL